MAICTQPRIGCGRAACAFLIVSLALARPVFAVEHPGTLAPGALCSSCHADKVSGRSVHSAMAAACTVCHLAQTQGDMTTVSLSMPKTQICFACHQKTAQLLQHASSGKQSCVDCHDAHSSRRRALLLADLPATR